MKSHLHLSVQNGHSCSDSSDSDIALSPRERERCTDKTSTINYVAAVYATIPYVFRCNVDCRSESAYCTWTVQFLEQRLETFGFACLRACD